MQPGRLLRLSLKGRTGLSDTQAVDSSHFDVSYEISLLSHLHSLSALWTHEDGKYVL